MKRSSKELKRIARDMLNNRYTVPMGAFIAATFIPAVIEIPFSLPVNSYLSPSQIIIFLLAEFIILLISQVLNAGVIQIHLNMTRNKAYKFSDLFLPFRQRTDHFFLAACFMNLLFIICSLPFLAAVLFYYLRPEAAQAIPLLIFCGIITCLCFFFVFLTYNFVMFFLLDYPEMKVMTAFRKSRLLMKKNKKRLLYIFFSFIGWQLLIPISLGIAALWIQPYCNETMVTFYLDCTGELDRIPVRDYTPHTSGSRFDTSI